MMRKVGAGCWVRGPPLERWEQQQGLGGAARPCLPWDAHPARHGAHAAAPCRARVPPSAGRGGGQVAAGGGPAKVPGQGHRCKGHPLARRALTRRRRRAPAPCDTLHLYSSPAGAPQECVKLRPGDGGCCWVGRRGGGNGAGGEQRRPLGALTTVAAAAPSPPSLRCPAPLIPGPCLETAIRSGQEQPGWHWLRASVAVLPPALPLERGLQRGRSAAAQTKFSRLKLARGCRRARDCAARLPKRR